MVHQYKLGGYNIVLDTCSGAVHVVDEVAYDIIAMFENSSADAIVTAIMEKHGHREDVTEEEVRLCIGDVEALKQAGKLFTPDTFDNMADMGFTELSMEPVVCAADDPAALTPEDLEVVKREYEILAEEMLRREEEGRPFTFYHYMIDLTGGPCIYKRLSGCGSGTEYMAVTPWGDLYPCHQFVGEEAYKLGDIFNGVNNNALREEFRSCNAYAREECKDCWAKLYCSGGCAANAYHATGTIRGVYEPGCELFRKRMECAIMIKAAQDDRKRGN